MKTRLVLATLPLSLTFPCIMAAMQQQAAMQQPNLQTPDLSGLTAESCAQNVQQWNMPDQNLSLSINQLDTQDMSADGITMIACDRRFQTPGAYKLGHRFYVMLFARALQVIRSHNLMQEFIDAH
jgi:hypothetical protein